MLSASTVSSISSDAFSSIASVSTPQSQYSADAFQPSTGNPLSDLIEAEKNYMKTLKIIDDQLAPLWTSNAPPKTGADFTALLKSTHDIVKVNRRFCTKLQNIAANPKDIKSLGTVLIQWVDDMEVPYANFSRGSICNLNQRQDIADRPEIRRFLDELSTNASYEITLESLFNAPIQQLKYYKALYGRLLDSSEPGKPDHRLLSNANQRIDTIMLLAQRNTNTAPSVALGPPPSGSHSGQKGLPLLQTDKTGLQSGRMDTKASDMVSFGQQLDCSQVTDIFTGAALRYAFQPDAGESLLLRNDLALLSDDTAGSNTLRVHLVLTTNTLIIAQDGGMRGDANSGRSYKLLHPPLAVRDVTVKAMAIDRELVGDYLIQFSVLGKKQLTMRADSKDIRNAWLGIDTTGSSAAALTPCPLTKVVQALTPGAKPDKPAVRRQDVFSIYGENSNEISPLSSDDSDVEDRSLPLLPKTTGGQVAPANQAKTLPHLPQPKPSLSASKDSGSAKERPSVPAKQTTLSTQDHRSDRQRSLSPSPQGRTDKSRSPSPHAAPKPKPTLSQGDRGVHPGAGKAVPHPHLPTKDEGAMRGAHSGNRDRLAPKPHPPTPQTRQHQAAPGIPGHALNAYPHSSYGQQRPPPHHYPAQQQQHQRPMHPGPYAQPPPQPQNHSGHAYRPGPPPMKGPGYGGGLAPSSSPVPAAAGAAAGAATGAAAHPRPTFPNGLATNRSPSPGLPSPGFPHQDNTRSASPYLGISSRANEDTSSPPRSPTPHMLNGQPNGIRQVLYSSNQCEVFHWKSESWYAVEGQCMLQVRQTYTNRSCVAVQLQSTGQLYLNAWILSSSVISQPLPTDVSLSVIMGNNKENYLIHFPQPAQASALYQVLQRTLQEAIQYGDTPSRPSSPLPPTTIARSDTLDVPDERLAVPQTLRVVMQCKCKLFVQNEHSNWSSFGSVSMKISQQSPSQRMHIEMESGKGNKATKLVSAIVQSRNVEKINPKRITFLLVNEQERTSMVYMVQVKEEQTGLKIYEYLRTKNAENGW